MASEYPHSLLLKMIYIHFEEFCHHYAFKNDDVSLGLPNVYRSVRVKPTNCSMICKYLFIDVYRGGCLFQGNHICKVCVVRFLKLVSSKVLVKDQSVCTR